MREVLESSRRKKPAASGAKDPHARTKILLILLMLCVALLVWANREHLFGGEADTPAGYPPLAPGQSATDLKNGEP